MSAETVKRETIDQCVYSVKNIIATGKLEALDSEKLKMEIKKWTKVVVAVVAYARQVSGHFEGSGQLMNISLKQLEESVRIRVTSCGALLEITGIIQLLQTAHHCLRTNQKDTTLTLVEEAVLMTSTETVKRETTQDKQSNLERCFSSVKIIIESGQLETLDSEKLKMAIKKWAKAVVSYARQVSGHFEKSSG
ncbi:hypothetical protein FRX31_030154 [Thalictrum thalictroides]|uniref:Uncharacterized protein n=1 Tax=Thalictrum thalictroides TaxID=46969 RepID=A0A7J6V6H8_THATH|nr:hypothetical protein FRX31_030154 [Thalictrum thalictroides]